MSGKEGNLARNTQNFENFRSATGPFKTTIIVLRVFLVKKKMLKYLISEGFWMWNGHLSILFIYLFIYLFCD